MGTENRKKVSISSFHSTFDDRCNQVDIVAGQLPALSQVLDGISRELKEKLLVKGTPGTIHLSRNCPEDDGQTDTRTDAQTHYCAEGECAARTQCGIVTVPDEHLGRYFSRQALGSK